MIARVQLSCVKRLAYICEPFRSYGSPALLIILCKAFIFYDYLFKLFILILQHYTELPDIKRVIVNTHAIEPQVCYLRLQLFSPFFPSFSALYIAYFILQALVEFFGTLSREWALECMKDLLLVNLRGNLQIIVQASLVLTVVHMVMPVTFWTSDCNIIFCSGCQRIL